MRLKLLTLALLAATAACSDPMSEFYTQMKRYGYIPYTTPLEVAGTGTLVGGSPKFMAIIANPGTCFPDVDSGANRLRFRDETVLPTTTAHFFVNTNIQANFLKALAAGAP